MAFLSPTPVKLTPPPPRAHICRINTRHQPSITTPHASTKLPETVRNLILEQKQHPIFEPSLLEPPLSTALNDLQTSTPPEFHRPSLGTVTGKACNIIADYHPLAIASARRTILLRFPGIGEPGGKLYPPFRAVACWRDLREFARVVGYYIVARTGFSERGMHVMKKVYEEMDVPVDAMLVGLECLKDEFAGFCGEDDVADVVEEGFDVLLGLLEF